MKIIDNLKIPIDNHERITFIRVDPEDLNITILNIIKEINNFSWIYKFDKNYVREGFLAKAEGTAKELTDSLKKNINNDITKDTGEYVVSELARESIINELKYLDIPLAELLGRKKKGNPGFDFHTVNDLNTIIFGEAKYLTNQNAYGSSLSQINSFIAKKKDIADLKLLDDFCNEEALEKVTQNIKGYAVAFSSKQQSTDILVKNIKNNENFKKLLNYEEIVIVAVNV